MSYKSLFPNSQMLQPHLLNINSFLHKLAMLFLLCTKFPVNTWSASKFSDILLIYLSIPKAILHCFNYYSLNICSDVCRC